MKGQRRSIIFVGLLTLAMCFMLFSGCASLKNDVDSDEVNSTALEEDVPGPTYYDFGDVLVPLELDVDKKKSFVYHAPGFTAGVLGLSGNVEVSSLIRFFENNMAKDNWKLVSSFKSPRTILFFSKTSRICIINITEGRFKSEVEIWVSPTMQEGEATLLK